MNVGPKFQAWVATTVFLVFFKFPCLYFYFYFYYFFIFLFLTLIFYFSSLYFVYDLIIIVITRKPSWRKGKRATAVRVWRQINDMRFPVSICEIFSRLEVENRHFPTVFWLSTSGGGTTSNINVIFASLKSTFSGLQFCRWQYTSIFIRLAVVASQICEITRNSEKIRTYSSSR